MNKKTLLIILVIAVLAVSALFTVSCRRTGGPQIKPDAEPVLDSVTLARKKSAYTDPENTICLELEQGKCETVVVTLNFTNTANLAIYSVKINNVEYGKAGFKSGASPQKVQIEVSPAFTTPGSYTIDVEAVYYSTGTNVKAISNFTAVSTAVRVAPTFTLTLDMSASLMSAETEIEIHENVAFMGYLEYLYDSGVMEAAGTAPEGYAFAGWYTSAAPDIDKDRSYDADDEYDFYKDMTFYAVYTPIYTYTVASGSATITGLTKFGRSKSILRLPETWDGNIVREIGPDAFSSVSFTTVYCNDSLRKIGARAFKDCGSLRSISFNDNLEEIGTQAFSGCTRLGNMSLFPDSLTTLGSKAFEYCGWDTGINITPHSKTLFIPETLREIGSYCFQYSTFINVYFINRESENPEPVTYGEGMFYSSSSLEKVQTATALTAAGEVAAISGTVSGAPRIPAKAFEYCTSLKTVTLAEGLQSIGSEAFMCVSGTMKNFNTLTLPDSLTSIGSYAFCNVPLTSLSFSSEAGSLLTSIGDYAFKEAKLSGEFHLKAPQLSVYGAFPFSGAKDITAIFLYAETPPDFSANETLIPIPEEWTIAITATKYYVPAVSKSRYRTQWGRYRSGLLIYSMDDIHYDTTINQKFSYEKEGSPGNYYLTITNIFENSDTIIIPDVLVVEGETLSIKILKGYIGTSKLKSVRFNAPQNITEISDNAFYNCSSLTSFCRDTQSSISRFELMTNLRKIGKYAFYNTGITEFKAPLSLEVIDEYAFKKSKLQKAIITGETGIDPNISIRYGAFAESKVELAVIGSRVYVLGQMSFGNCDKLTAFVIMSDDIPNMDGNHSYVLGVLGSYTTAYIYTTQNFINKVQALSSSDTRFTYKTYYPSSYKKGTWSESGGVTTT